MTPGPGWRPYLLGYGLAVVFLVAALLVERGTGFPSGFFSRDPALVLDAHPLIGLQSHIGVLIWFATGAVCLFSAALLWTAGADRSRSRFLMWAGIFSIVLALDDLILLHDVLIYRIGDRLEPILGVDDPPGFSELGLYTLYFVGFAAFAWIYRRTLVTRHRGWLVLALVLFAASVAIDLVQHRLGAGRLFFEDGFKLLGIVGWAVYWQLWSFASVRRLLGGDPGDPGPGARPGSVAAGHGVGTQAGAERLE